MIHDINNANTIAIGYTRFLADVLEGERREMAEKMLSRLERSSAIIGSVATHREALESGSALKRVDLDRVIRTEIANHPAARIRYEGRPIAVLADDLLSEVFANLIGNAVKFGDPSVGITVMVEDRGGGGAGLDRGHRAGHPPRREEATSLHPFRRRGQRNERPGSRPLHLPDAHRTLRREDPGGRPGGGGAAGGGNNRLLFTQKGAGRVAIA